MRRCAIVIHTENGNCLTIAKTLTEELTARNVDVRLYRVEDNDLHILANTSETVNEALEDILDLPIADATALKKADMIILGSPTRFGNMSAELKTFLDKTYPLSESRELEDKFFACFTSCRHSTCEGAHCIDSMLYWAQNMGMIHIPFGYHRELANCNQPVSGLVHLEGTESTIKPSDRLGTAIEAYAETLASFIQE